MLISCDIWKKIRLADRNYGCAGDGHMHDVRQFSPLCDRAIRKGEMYVEQIDILPETKRVPRRYMTVSRHCSSCALMFFPAIKVEVFDAD